METALLLIALGYGFKIFSDGIKERPTRKGLKSLGIILGVFIMLFAFFGALCTTWFKVRCGYGGMPFYSCPLHSKPYGNMSDYHSKMFMKYHHPPIAADTSEK